MKLLFILVLLTISITAQSSENIASHEENSEHNLHHNHVALFLGGTTFYKNNQSYFSLGVDYLYRPNNENPWAYSIMAEAVFAEHTEFVIAIPLYHYVIGSWWLRAGPGIEIIQEEEHHGDDVKSKTHVEFLFRIGTGYYFYSGNFVVSPSVDIDLVRNNDAIVWGLNFGYSF